MMTELPTFGASTMVGVSRANLAHVAPTPTHSGMMALTRSAFARKASASAAHWMVFAAILREWVPSFTVGGWDGMLTTVVCSSYIYVGTIWV